MVYDLGFPMLFDLKLYLIITYTIGIVVGIIGIIAADDSSDTPLYILAIPFAPLLLPSIICWVIYDILKKKLIKYKEEYINNKFISLNNIIKELHHEKDMQALILNETKKELLTTKEELNRYKNTYLKQLADDYDSLKQRRSK